MSKESLVELIKKLSAMTEENGASETEAIFAAEKIAKIKMKYNIELEDLECDEFEATGEDVITEYTRLPKYLETLLAHLSKAFNCQSIRMRPKNRKVNFKIVGLPHEIVMCIHFYKYLSRVLINESKGRKNKNAFCRGMIHSIIEKISPPKPTGEDVSLNQSGVIIYRDAAIKNYIAAKIGKIQNRKFYTTHNDNSYAEGRARGKTVSLNSPIKGSGQRQIGM